jgi:hypothetical protein
VTTRTRPYTLRFDLQAPNRYTAILTAGKRVRHNVRILAMVKAESFAPGWWTVEIEVEETLRPLDPPEPDWNLPESADPITAAKWEAARHGR